MHNCKIYPPTSAIIHSVAADTLIFEENERSAGGTLLAQQSHLPSCAVPLCAERFRYPFSCF